MYIYMYRYRPLDIDVEIQIKGGLTNQSNAYESMMLYGVPSSFEVPAIVGSLRGGGSKGEGYLS